VNTKSNSRHLTPVMVVGKDNVNNLGVIRSLGRHGVPTTLLTLNPQDIVRYSRYTGKKLLCPEPKESEIQFIDFLLNRGKQMNEKCVLIPTNDSIVVALARHKKELEQYYLLPFSGFEVVEQLVNKSKFYQLLSRMSIPHPKTYFPANTSDLESIGQKIDYPYIIKPAYMHLFTAEFNTKCFMINSREELDLAIRRLKNRNIEVIIQDLIPGNELYSFQTYFNNKSQPLAICGYDKLRQDPPDFGIGTLWKSVMRPEPITSAVQVLQAIKYYGIAEPEFKKDPRDGQYKFLEINARTVVPNALPAGCGVDISYIAYLDSVGQYTGDLVSPKGGILWIDEINDLRASIKQISMGTLKIKEAALSLKGKKVYATAAWDDPLPFFISLFNITGHYFNKRLNRKRNGQSLRIFTAHHEDVKRMKNIFKLIILYSLDMLGINALCRRFNRDKAVILWYHGICDDGFDLLKGLDDRHIPKSAFREHLRYIKSKGYVFVSMTELVTAIKNKRKIDKMAVLTFDDGFRNIVENAYPIMKEFGARCCYYLVADLIGTDKLLWTDFIGTVVRSQEKGNYQFIFEGETFNYFLDDKKSYQHAIMDIKAKLRTIPDSKRLEYLKKFSHNKLKNIPDEFAMATWEQIKGLDPDIFEIGGHTRRHPDCTNLTTSEGLEDEIYQSKINIEKNIGRKVIHFCYPNGSYDDRVITKVKEYGYESAVAARGLTGQHSDLYKLNRVEPSEQFILFKARISGTTNLLKTFLRSSYILFTFFKD
jgi:D-aspartate ligase